MVEERLAERDAREAFVLDGYPRTVDQVANLDDILARLGAPVDGAIELVVDAEELIVRLLTRSETSGRTDDTEHVIRHRQQVYAAETAPLIAEYDRRGLLLRVDGVGTVEEVTARIDDILGLAGPVASSEDA